MAAVFWADRAKVVYDTLLEPIQEEIDARLRTAGKWPEWYPLVQGKPRWAGHRRFVVRRRWAVLYRVLRSDEGAGDQVYVTDIFPAMSNY